MRKGGLIFPETILLRAICKVVLVGCILLLITACGQKTAPVQETVLSPEVTQPVQQEGEGAETRELPRDTTGTADDPTQRQAMDEPLPVRFRSPSFMVAESVVADAGELAADDIAIQVGADITSTTGPVPLREILKKLADLKKMNISWASDVSQELLVDVNIKSEDDFFGAIDNLLRQVDYFHRVEGNTLVVLYKDTKQFHIAMPFMASTFSTGVGGNVLGGEVNVDGTIKLTSSDNKFDIWENIQQNLNKILEIWTTQASTAPAAAAGTAQQTGSSGQQPAAAAPAVITRPGTGKGYYTIDKPIGLISVTASRPLLVKIEEYFKNLQRELLRQVSIEAKIVEVELNNASQTGINWTNLLGSTATGLNFNMEFGTSGTLYPGAGELISKITLDAKNFSLVMNALATQGKTRVLANPKISVMNGQPAMISVGSNVTYIDKVETTVSDSGVPSTSVTTSSVLSGLGLAVVATVINNDEIILNLTPVSTNLTEPIQYEDIGSSRIGLPRVKVKELSTTVRLKNGEMLVVGGLIDSTDADTDTTVPFLGEIPVLSKFFKHKDKSLIRKELIILLRPVIL